MQHNTVSPATFKHDNAIAILYSSTICLRPLSPPNIRRKEATAPPYQYNTSLIEVEGQSSNTHPHLKPQKV